MSDLQTLQKYDNWKKSKSHRKTWIALLANLIGLPLALLLTWGILQVGVGSAWMLMKTSFASKEKIVEYIPKIEEVDSKLKSSVLSKPMNWLSKKHEEEIKANTHDLGIITISPTLESSVKKYAGILAGVWFLTVLVFWIILAWLSYWIIGKFVWKEPKLVEEEI
ncbi:protein of unknown function [endosymbiont DhMRE of Dentiscutata heterogama]|uniref:hypothetical protein n=1 Tax=endosymbiont DhMRE of Dentiscutata heterogama TaxID=1609546 RepID=UPI000629DA1F|nr:hypothetical protein [endosymbiont DhMRE of Dentiscutata heterogama]CFW93056.1 protein of unknown function [endosymbiont DhMRE of Dentiscutata heterogama]